MACTAFIACRISIAHGVNDALQQGCTLIGGLAVGEGYVHRTNRSELQELNQ